MYDSLPLYLTLTLLLGNPVCAQNQPFVATLTKPTQAHHAYNLPSNIQITIRDSKPLEKGTEVTTTLYITSKDGKPLTLDDLKKVHTEKVHLLIFDQTLGDYQHIHPRATKNPGECTFTWTPKREGFYRLWVNLVTVKTKQQEFIMIDLPSVSQKAIPVDKSLCSRTTIEGLTFALTFNKENLKVDQPLVRRSFNC